ncbi:MAG: hypothetical protein IH940_10260 [Acidobacteria bacterium]|nr:hypothetical protein [Acidobacteriota bacterium]
MTSPKPEKTPYKVTVNLPRAFASSKGILNPVANHEQFLELIFALAGPGFQRSYDQFLEAESGRRLLDERPDIVATLTDRSSLAECAPGTLGHAYLDFMNQNRLDAGLYDNTYHDLPAIAARLGWDEDFHYVVHRGIALHDVLHVLGGYGPDIGGEFGLLGFTHGQVNGWITGANVGTLMVVPLGVKRRERLRYWNEAVRRGRAASMLFAAPYEELMDTPLDTVRLQLGIEPELVSHPAGHMYSRFQFGRASTRMLDAAYEPYRYEPESAA